MPAVHYYLKEKNSKEPTLISLFYTVDKKRLTLSTGEKIHPYFWSFKNERANSRCPEQERINEKLDNLEAKAKEIEQELIIKNQYATARQVKERLQIVLGKKENRETLFTYFTALIKEREANPKYKAGTIKNYKSAWKQLQGFTKNEKVNEFDFSDITYQWWKRFIEYLFKQGLSNNYAYKILSVLRTFLNEATREGVNKFSEYKNFGIGIEQNQADTIYLTNTELEKLYRIDFSNNPKFERARDLFLLGAFTGLRHSDFSRLDLDKHIRIIDGYPIISIIATKTNQSLLIPLHPIVEAVLNKYGGKAPKLSQQKMNDHLKDMGKASGLLNDKVNVRETRAGNTDTEAHERYKMLSSHTCRRSFATNAFLAGWPTLSILKITGHTTETSFMRYIRVSKEQNAVHIAKTQFRQIDPEGVKVKEALEVLTDRANDLNLTDEEIGLLEKIKSKSKVKLPSSYLRIAK